MQIPIYLNIHQICSINIIEPMLGIINNYSSCDDDIFKLYKNNFFQPFFIQYLISNLSNKVEESF